MVFDLCLGSGEYFQCMPSINSSAFSVRLCAWAVTSRGLEATGEAQGEAQGAASLFANFSCRQGAGRHQIAFETEIDSLWLRFAANALAVNGLSVSPPAVDGSWRNVYPAIRFTNLLGRGLALYLALNASNDNEVHTGK